MIKLIVVNETQILKQKRLEAFSKTITQFFLTKNIRNKNQLKKAQEITLVFLSPSQMKKINFQFRKKNKATDVLSFHSDDPASLGELLFCIDVLKTQAKVQKHSFEQEFIYLLIHGVLHLLGYDHEISKKERIRMFHLQDQCFSLLNKDYVADC